MKITYVKMTKFTEERFKASITIVVDDVLYISRIRVIYDNQKEKFFLAMPSVKGASGKWFDIFHPIDSEGRKVLENFLLQFYEYADKNQKEYMEMVLKEDCKDTCIQQQSIYDFREKETEADVVSNESYFSITSFQIRLNNVGGSLCAKASFMLDHSYIIHNLKIVYDEYMNGYQLYMPRYETKAHSKKELIHPVKKLLREKLEEILFHGYQMLLEKQQELLMANIIEGQKKPLDIQSVDDFDYEFTGSFTVEKKDILEEIMNVIEMTESPEEKIYRNPQYVIERVIEQKDRNYISGKIVGYVDNKYYKVFLADGQIGKIECSLMDRREKVVDYKNKIFQDFVPNVFESLDEISLLKYANKDYYFEITGKESGNICILSVENVKSDYLDYVIENECILQGTIIQIGNNYVGIEIPYGFVFLTKINFVFGCDYDVMFDYMNYLNAEVSVVVTYQEEDNRLYPLVANTKYNLLDGQVCYIFPALTFWEKTYYSKLWLDKNLLLLDKHKKYPIKNINQLFVIQNIRGKGAERKFYKGNIKKICSEKVSKRYRKNILTVEWLINLRGYNEKTAIDYLEQKGFLFNIQYIYNFSVENGIVLRMEPNIDNKMMIPRNTIICLVISKGARKEYVLPDFKGMHTKEVRTVLKKHQIKVKKEISNEKVDGISDNCVIKTFPDAGSVVRSEGSVSMLIYQENIYESPFAMRKNEFPRIYNKSKGKGTVGIILQFCDVEWRKNLLVFILKHKVANKLHIEKWLKMQDDTGLSVQDIEGALKYLQYLSFIGCMDPSDEVSDRDNIQFLFPLNNLYETYREYFDYNGRFSWRGKEVSHYKVRAAENQAFLKLYDILRQNYFIKYEVDCLQVFDFNDEKRYLKIHIAVNAESRIKNNKKVYFIEAIRFWYEEDIKEGWDKLVRYSMYMNKSYHIKPCLLLVFEDELHYQRFINKKPIDYKFGFLELYFTWDQLTNSDYMKFEEVFIKEDIIC